MTQLAIKGHETRGKEVIELLEMMGGKNYSKHSGIRNVLYFIHNNTEEILADFNFYDSNYTVFTLEEFFEKFPYKVGDRVKTVYGSSGKVYVMQWIDNEIQYRLDFGHHTSGWHSTENLQSYKEETMEENTDKALAPDLKGEDYSGRRFGYKIPNGYEFDCIQNNEIILKPIKPKYPKTYKECCEVLNLTKYPPALTPNKSIYTTQYKDFPHYYEIQKLAQLLVCRNAYWKIVGEQMGLGKHWEPDWKDDQSDKYFIYYVRDKLWMSNIRECNRVLVFPTEETRDAFYENFKDLIEKCKELL